LIPRNVASSVKAPKLVKKEIHPLSPEQAKTLLEAARGDRFESLYVIAVHCGLREGELLGLKWEDLDLEDRKLSVRRTLSETINGPIFEVPKNGKGRSVKLTARAVETLRAHLERQLKEIEQAGDLYDDNGLVFPNQTGRPMCQWSLYGGPFKRLLQRAKLLEKTRFHDLRHTLAFGGRAPQICAGAFGACDDLHNPRHLQSYAARHG
jgi:integrase